MINGFVNFFQCRFVNGYAGVLQLIEIKISNRWKGLDTFWNLMKDRKLRLIVNFNYRRFSHSIRLFFINCSNKDESELVRAFSEKLVRMNRRISERNRKVLTLNESLAQKRSTEDISKPTDAKEDKTNASEDKSIATKGSPESDK